MYLHSSSSLCLNGVAFPKMMKKIKLNCTFPFSSVQSNTLIGFALENFDAFLSLVETILQATMGRAANKN